jgi:hypothetical protein
MYHFVCPAKYRKSVFRKEVDESLKDVCIEISNRYETDQNSPPHSFFFTSGCLVNISLAVILLIVCIILVTLYFGTDCTKK